MSGSMKNKLGVIQITVSKNMKYRGEAISVLMVGFESPGIELPWRGLRSPSALLCNANTLHVKS